jgi:MFS family permease
MSFLRREIRAVMGGLPATFWWLWAGMLVNAVATFVLPFLAMYLTRRGFSPTTSGMLVGLVGAGSIVGAPLGGILADAVGRRRTIVASLVLTAAVTASLAFVTSPAPAAVLVTLLGVFVHLFRPAALAVVADVVPREDRVRAFGLNYWAVNLGIAVSAVLGGAIAERSFTGLFLADAATTLVFAALVLLRVPETRPAEAAASRESVLRGLGTVATDGVFAAFLLLHVAYAAVLLQFFAAVPIDLLAHGVSPAEFGRILAVNGVVIALLQPFAARATARFDPARVLAAACVLTGVGYGLFSVLHTPLLYAAAVVVITLGEVAYTPNATALVANLASPAQRGRYQGAYSMAWGLATALGPGLGALALERAGSVATWLGCAGVAALAGAGQLAAARARRRRLAATAAAAR